MTGADTQTVTLLNGIHSAGRVSQVMIKRNTRIGRLLREGVCWGGFLLALVYSFLSYSLLPLIDTFTYYPAARDDDENDV